MQFSAFHYKYYSNNTLLFTETASVRAYITDFNAAGQLADWKAHKKACAARRAAAQPPAQTAQTDRRRTSGTQALQPGTADEAARKESSRLKRRTSSRESRHSGSARRDTSAQAGASTFCSLPDDIVLEVRPLRCAVLPPEGALGGRGTRSSCSIQPHVYTCATPATRSEGDVAARPLAVFRACSQRQERSSTAPRSTCQSIHHVE
jgi:hypothetical protein